MMQNSFLYKYKAFNKYNFSGVENDTLWISNAYNQNDAHEIPFYINTEEELLKEYNYSLFDLLAFQNYIANSIYFASFSKDNKNPILWANYADKYTGFLLEYAIEDIENSLKSISNEKDFPFVKSIIKHSESKEWDLTIPFIRFLNNQDPNFYISKEIFKKEKIWKVENEIRYYLFDIKNELLENLPSQNGFDLPNIKPKSITIGYKMENKNYLELKKLCEIKEIDMYVCLPDLCSQNYGLKIIPIAEYLSSISTHYILNN